MGFTAGLLQFLSGTVLQLGDRERQGGVGRDKPLELKRRIIRKKSVGENVKDPFKYANEKDEAETEDIYDYEDYVLNQQLQTQSLFPEQLLDLKYSNIRNNIIKGQKSIENKIMGITQVKTFE